MLAQHTFATPRADRRFFTGMSLVAAVIVFAGFAPTYFLKSIFGTPALSPLFHVHGLLFTSWIALFIIQTSLIAIKRVRIHQSLGILGGFLAAAMLVVGYLAAIASARHAAAMQGAPGALAFLAVPLGDLLLFGVLVGAGLYFRRKPQIHKRLLLLATIGLLAPAIARLPHVAAYGPIGFFGLTDLFIVVCLVYDRVVRGRIHPVFLWGGLSIVASQVLRVLIGGTETWVAFANWLIR